MSTNLIQIQNGAKQYGSKVLFEDVTFAVNSDEHVGVIGPNGAGKTTLFKILLGLEELDSGEVIKKTSLKVAHLAQHDSWGVDETPRDYLAPKIEVPFWQIEQKAPELGLSVEEHFDVPIQSLSGGFRMRIKLLALWGQQPDLMLLDEPTNYLDLETTLVLERFLQNYERAFLLISHDREFLQRTTDQILEVEGGEVTKYPGALEDYFEQKALLRQQLEAQATQQAEKRKAILDFVARFGAKATKAKQAQSRLKTLQKIEVVNVKDLPVRARISIPEPKRVSKHMLTLRDCIFGYRDQDKRVVFCQNLEVSAGDRIAFVGFNGVGKSTLLKSIAEILPVMDGEVKFGFEVTHGYFAQHVADGLNSTNTVYQELNKVCDVSISPQEIRNLAGSLLFAGDAIDKRISVLSGGEKARVSLGQILLQRKSILILDEPTNHLDFDTVEALTQALKEFKGAVLFVSHDRSFVSRVANKIVVLEPYERVLKNKKTQSNQNKGVLTEAIPYLQTYEDYLNSILSEVFEPKEFTDKQTLAKAESSAPIENKNLLWQRMKDLEKLVSKLEKSMERSEHEEADLSCQLELAAQDPMDSQLVLKKLQELHQRKTALEAEWERGLTELEELKSRLGC